MGEKPSRRDFLRTSAGFVALSAFGRSSNVAKSSAVTTAVPVSPALPAAAPVEPAAVQAVQQHLLHHVIPTYEKAAALQVAQTKADQAIASGTFNGTLTSAEEAAGLTQPISGHAESFFYSGQKAQVNLDQLRIDYGVDAVNTALKNPKTLKVLKQNLGPLPQNFRRPGEVLEGIAHELGELEAGNYEFPTRYDMQKTLSQYDAATHDVACDLFQKTLLQKTRIEEARRWLQTQTEPPEFSAAPVLARPGHFSLRVPRTERVVSPDRREDGLVETTRKTAAWLRQMFGEDLRVTKENERNGTLEIICRDGSRAEALMIARGLDGPERSR